MLLFGRLQAFSTYDIEARTQVQGWIDRAQLFFDLLININIKIMANNLKAKPQKHIILLGIVYL